MRLFGKIDGGITEHDAVLIWVPFTAVGWLDVITFPVTWTPQDVYNKFGIGEFGKGVFCSINWDETDLETASWSETDVKVAAWSPETVIEGTWQPQDVYSKFGKQLFGRGMYSSKNWDEVDTSASSWSAKAEVSSSWSQESTTTSSWQQQDIYNKFSRGTFGTGFFGAKEWSGKILTNTVWN